MELVSNERVAAAHTNRQRLHPSSEQEMDRERDIRSRANWVVRPETRWPGGHVETGEDREDRPSRIRTESVQHSHNH